jgi:hypothetical protein
MCSSKLNSILAPTVKPTPKKLVCVNGLTSQDLDMIKATDSFMYYSIPSDVRAAIRSRGQGLSLATCGTGNNTSQIVMRQSRISFERHSDLEIDDLLAEGVDNLHVEDSDDEEDDLFMSFIAALEKQVDGANPNAPQ